MGEWWLTKALSKIRCQFLNLGGNLKKSDTKIRSRSTENIHIGFCIGQFSFYYYMGKIKKSALIKMKYSMEKMCFLYIAKFYKN